MGPLVAERHGPEPVARGPFEERLFGLELLGREIAAIALKAYGHEAVKRLEKANVDRALIDACRGITPEMEAIQKKLNTMSIDLSFENSKLDDILSFIRDFSGLNILVDASANSFLACRSWDQWCMR